MLKRDSSDFADLRADRFQVWDESDLRFALQDSSIRCGTPLRVTCSLPANFPPLRNRMSTMSRFLSETVLGASAIFMLDVVSRSIRSTLATSSIVLALAFPSLMPDPVFGWQEAKPAATVEEVKLQRVPPKSIDEVVKSIETLPGFEVELVACEPLVHDPVAFLFDPRGRLLVIEMLDYSEQDKESLGRLVRLEDVDNDGRMDKSEVLVDRLSWPTALALSGEGVLIGAAPELIWLPKASIATEAAAAEGKEVWATGFGRNNVQGLLNSFRWGIDQRWHATTSSNGGDVTGKLTLEKLQLRLQDFAFDSRSRTLTPIPGGGQHGMDFNAWGDKFVSSNSDHFQQIIAWQYPGWTSQLLSKPLTLRRSMATDGPQAEVFRASPVEAWRTWRTELRVSGKVPGIVEGGGRAAGYFTGATGVVIYDGDQWGPLPHPIALVADVGSNLIHRKRLVQEGLWWRGERMDEKAEIVRSRDIWFRPVQLGDGPDGCLYIADMAREVIEHPASLPPMIKSQLDLTSGRDKGRIWRVKATGRPIRREAPNLDQLDTEQLARVIDHPNGWHRETAARLLYERNDVKAIQVLREIVSGSPRPEARVQAMALLASWSDGIDEAVAVAGAKDAHWRVQEQAFKGLARHGKSWLEFTALKPLVEQIAEAGKIESQFVLALYLGQLATDKPSWRDDPSFQTLLVKLMRSQLNQERRSELASWSEYVLALEWAAGSNGPKLWDALFELEITDAAVLEPWLDSLVFSLFRHQPTSVALKQFEQQWEKFSGDSPIARALAPMLVAALERKFTPATTWCRSDADQAMQVWLRTNLLPRVTEVLAHRGNASTGDFTGWSLLSRLPADERLQLLENGLAEGVDIPVQQVALRTLVANDANHFKLLLERMPQLLPESYVVALQALSSRENGALLLLTAIENGQIAAGTVPSDIWLILERQPNEQIAERAKKVHAQSTPTVAWDEVAATYREAWETPGDVEQGRLVFRKMCGACHRVENEGVAIGPSLASVIEKSNEQIAISVFQPNIEVDPKYQMYQLVTDDGVVHTGIMESAQSDAVVIRNGKGELERYQRSEIEVLKASGKSLMPEGLQAQVSPKDFRDLLLFIKQYAGRNQAGGKE